MGWRHDRRVALPDVRQVGPRGDHDSVRGVSRRRREDSMTITARFDSVCPTCGAGIEAGTRVEWTRGVKATHETCAPATAATRARQGKRHGSRYTRFSSGAEHFTNRAGRCEDAPCCGCCS